jgi:hypothetical protein
MRPLQTVGPDAAPAVRGTLVNGRAMNGLLVLLIWFLISIPVGIVAGRLLARMSDFYPRADEEEEVNQ